MIYKNDYFRLYQREFSYGKYALKSYDRDNKKLLLKSFGDYHKVMKQYIKKNKLSFHSKKDVMKMLSKYEELVDFIEPGLGT